MNGVEKKMGREQKMELPVLVIFSCLAPLCGFNFTNHGP